MYINMYIKNATDVLEKQCFYLVCIANVTIGKCCLVSVFKGGMYLLMY